MVRHHRRVVALLATALATTAATAVTTLSPAAPAAVATSGGAVLISEVAGGGPGGANDSFVELRNYGDEPVSLDRWRIYHCGASGSRGASPLVPPLSGVTLAPGQTYVIAHRTSTLTGVANAQFSTALAADAFGIWLEDGAARLVDRLAISPSTRDSVCGPPVPSVLDFRLGESYQRVSATGDVTADFVRATRTPQADNATAPTPRPPLGDVVISEVANGGPGGDADEFVEVANTGSSSHDVSGWRVYRCGSLGSRLTSDVQVTLPAGTVLAPGRTLVVAPDSVTVPAGVPRYPGVALSEDGFGVLLEDEAGSVRDAVGVYDSDGEYEPAIDGACTRGTPLPDRLDYGSNHSYQRVAHTGDNSADFVRAPRTVGVLASPDEAPEPAEARDSKVRISEVTHGGPGGANDTFLELANYGTRPVSLRGWTVQRCQTNGRRALTPAVGPLGDVTLAPGGTFLAVQEGSPLYSSGKYDASFTGALSADGYGLSIQDEQGRLVDRVGVTRSAYSPCTDGVSLIPVLETMRGESWQRLSDTGNNVRDFVQAPRTPGLLDTALRAPEDIPAEALAPVTVPAAPAPTGSTLRAPASGATGVSRNATLSVVAQHTTGAATDLTFRGGPRLSVVDNATNVFSGVSQQAPPAGRKLDGERRTSGAALLRGEDVAPIVTDATKGFPYQRFELVVQDHPATFDMAWSGRSTGSNELQMYVWNHRTNAWQLLDAAAGRNGGPITLVGSVRAADAVRGNSVSVLVQDGPAVHQAFDDEASEPNHAFKDPDRYDFSFGYIPDPQQLTEAYRDVYADQVSWLVSNKDARRIAFTANSGDLIQNYLWGTHIESRARDEYRYAAAMDSVLTDAGMPHGVLPGNHDVKWGRATGLFNEYFPPSRYAGQPWYGGSWRPGDNVNNYDTVEVRGAKFLIVNVGFVDYFDRQETINWANTVIRAHPDHNVVVVTHEYLNRDGVPTTPEDDEWTSLGSRIWDEIVRPNRNVFLVLSGHVNGTSYNVRHDVDGVPGRTVTEMLADYQNFELEGQRKTGFLRLLQFDLDTKTVSVNTYSPTLDEHNAWEYDTAHLTTDAADEFTVPVALNDVYDKRVQSEGFGLVTLSATPIATVEAAPNGEQASARWSGLAADRRYLWFVEARDSAGASARSAVWSFRTAR